MLTKQLAKSLAESAHRAASESSGSQRWCPHDPTPKQRLFLDLDCLEALYGGAAGGGKSDALLMDALAFSDVPGYSALLLRRTYTDLALPGAIMDRSHEWLAGTAAHWTDKDKRWTFPSGATLVFGYLDGPRDHFRYMSSEFQYIGFDEVTQFEERHYTYLFSRLRRTRGVEVPLRQRCATNPGGIGHDWVKRRFIDEPAERQFIPARLDDNPYLDAVEYERSLANLDPITWKQLREGAWIRDTTGLVYHSFRDDSRVDRLPELPPGERWYYVLGCDFGVTDPTAYVELAFTEHSDTVYVTRAEQWPGLAPSQTAEKAQEWEREIGEYDAIIGDISGLGKGMEAEWAHRFYMPMQPAAKSRKLGYIKFLNGDLHHLKVRFLNGFTDDLVKDLRALSWKDEKHKEEHPSQDNHLTDALLYGWREARHWAWEERPEPVADPHNEPNRAHEQRKAAMIRRNERRMEMEDGYGHEADDNDWILGP